MTTTAPVETGRSELTVRAVLAGCGIGAVLLAANLYMCLKTGWYDSGNLAASILGFALLAGWKGGPAGPYSVMENVVTQTTAVSVAAMPGTIGLLAAIPALSMLGRELPAWALVAWGVAAGVLGVLIAASLSGQLFDREKLAFPTGVATAELITQLHRASGKSGGQGRGFFGSALAAAAWTWLRDRLAVLPQAVTLGGPNIALSPMMFGVGLLLGPSIALSLILGSAIAWGILGPQLVNAGVVPSTDYQALVPWLTWPGVALISGSVLTSLVQQRAAFRDSLRDLLRVGASTQGKKIFFLPLLALFGAIVGIAVFVLAVGPLQILAVLALLPLLCSVSARVAGQTDIAPHNSVTQIAQGFASALPPPGAAANVAAGSLVAGASTQVCCALWSWKTAHVLGGSLRRQITAQLIGVGFGAVVAVPLYRILTARMVLGSEGLPAPSAIQAKAVGELLAAGSGALPPYAGTAAIVALVAGIVLEALAGRRGFRHLIAGAIGVGFIVPAPYAAAIAVGAAASALIGRLGVKDWPRLSQVWGSGLIIGESLIGIGLAASAALG